MKKLSLMAITILLTCSVHSQKLPDSTAIPNAQLRLALQLIEQGKQCAEELALQRTANDLLYQKIAVKDSTIYQYKSSMQMQDKVIEDYVKSEANLTEQRKNLERLVKSLNKKIKRQKTKTFITSLAGVIGIATAGILLVK